LPGLEPTLGPPPTRWRTYSFVVVLPYEPVMATTIGATSRSRSRALVTNPSESRCSSGRAKRAARYTYPGDSSATRTTLWAVAAGGRTLMRNSVPVIPAKRPSRGVHRSGAVRPRRPRPTGPVATTAAVTNPAGSHTNDAAAATIATTIAAAFSQRHVHQR